MKAKRDRGEWSERGASGTGMNEKGRKEGERKGRREERRKRGRQRGKEGERKIEKEKILAFFPLLK